MVGIASNSKYEQLRPHALNTLIPSYVDQEGYQQAIELSDQIIKEYPDHEIVVEKLYGKGLIYKYDLKDFDQAEQMFKTVIANYPEHMTAQSAKEELESMGKKYGEDEMAATESANKLSIENYPNPFNPDTHIQFTLPEEGQVTAAIYNSMGQEVTTLLHEKLAQGKHSIQWNGKDHNGRPVVSGVYFYQIRFQDQLLARKMLLIR
jgi:tetratricopeptide (TPR) repeat protein